MRENAGRMLQGWRIGVPERFCGLQFPRHGYVRLLCRQCYRKKWMEEEEWRGIRSDVDH